MPKKSFAAVISPELDDTVEYPYFEVDGSAGRLALVDPLLSYMPSYTVGSTSPVANINTFTSTPHATIQYLYTVDMTFTAFSSSSGYYYPCVFLVYVSTDPITWLNSTCMKYKVYDTSVSSSYYMAFQPLSSINATSGTAQVFIYDIADRSFSYVDRYILPFRLAAGTSFDYGLSFGNPYTSTSSGVVGLVSTNLGRSLVFTGTGAPPVPVEPVTYFSLWRSLVSVIVPDEIGANNYGWFNDLVAYVLAIMTAVFAVLYILSCVFRIVSPKRRIG